MEEERRVAEDARQALVLLEKKRISLQTEVDDLHAALENVRYSSALLYSVLPIGYFSVFQRRGKHQNCQMANCHIFLVTKPVV